MFLIVKKFGIQNTSFKRLKTRGIFNRNVSEDLPHKSGIKTPRHCRCCDSICRKTCPTNRGLRRSGVVVLHYSVSRKTCPTNRGLRHKWGKVCIGVFGRKTCPTNRGLRLLRALSLTCQLTSEDLPHKSGIKTVTIRGDVRLLDVGRLALQIGD